MRTSASNAAFGVFAVALVVGLGMIATPLAVLAVSGLALLLSFALARSDRASGG